MKNVNWSSSFKTIYEKAVSQYKAGQRGSDTYFDASEKEFLKSIGHTAQEIYDFAEDGVTRGEPDYETALLVAAVRRDYFIVVMEGKASDKIVAPGDLTGKDVAEEGIVWLPRIIEKAEAKLKGEMDPDLMYGCGGDRDFFKQNNVHAADFLRNVWASDGDRQKIIDYVKSCREQA
ncbi:MAG: hypothetical protein AAF571_01085 [Verrucomicrobiota bacterium]